ncbi:MAG: DUF4349 domain-containing protein [Chloroflexi bacterium]|nr:DUF4349 domain-containing protein [Chloroflexota bacterium]
MKSRSVLFTLSILAAMVILAGCGGAMSTEVPVVATGFFDAPMEPAATEAPVGPLFESKEVEGAEEVPLPGADSFVVPASTMAPAFEISNQAGENVIVQNTNRKIIKNADVRLLVRDTDVAIDRTTQIIGDLGGYIISSRVWYQDYFGNNLKYATMTLGIPVDQFERALTRLRELAVRVLDENASGEDVTDQYVDLQSELQNLEATRARIQEFLKDAKTVDEALRINQELANIESQIEQIKGRMNYLADRAAFSTITVNFEPELPILTPTPTPTITPTFTPRPTSTPIPWKPGETFTEAKNTVVSAYQGIINFLIWLVVVIIPILLPFALILWAGWKLFSRRPKTPGA